MNFLSNNDAIAKLKALSANSSYKFNWSDKRKRFSRISASIFFIGVMLDSSQPAERAWAGGKHFVENYFPEETIWNDIAICHLARLKSICQKGYDGVSYANRHSYGTFHRWIKDNALIMLAKYNGDPRLIWNVAPQEVNLIYDRFIEFHGIGDQLAKMAQFILVRDHGVAGGKKSRSYLKIKPDIHVRKVAKRLGISPTEKTKDVVNSIESQRYRSQADVDAVLFNVGRKFCFLNNPDCAPCPFSNVCAKYIE